MKKKRFYFRYSYIAVIIVKSHVLALWNNITSDYYNIISYQLSYTIFNFILLYLIYLYIYRYVEACFLQNQYKHAAKALEGTFLLL